jgi:hypothetical protein
MLKASKAEWGAAVASGKLNNLPMYWGFGGSCRWEKDGKVVAFKKPGPLGTDFFLAKD